MIESYSDVESLLDESTSVVAFRTPTRFFCPHHDHSVKKKGWFNQRDKSIVKGCQLSLQEGLSATWLRGYIWNIVFFTKLEFALILGTNVSKGLFGSFPGPSRQNWMPCGRQVVGHQ